MGFFWGGVSAISELQRFTCSRVMMLMPDDRVPFTSSRGMKAAGREGRRDTDTVGCTLNCCCCCCFCCRADGRMSVTGRAALEWPGWGGPVMTQTTGVSAGSLMPDDWQHQFSHSSYEPLYLQQSLVCAMHSVTKFKRKMMITTASALPPHQFSF